MARLNNKKELWSHLSQVQAVRDATGTFGSTTLTAAADSRAIMPRSRLLPTPEPENSPTR